MSGKESAEKKLNTFTEFWGCEELSDVVFLVGENPDVWRIASHKLVLSKYSPVFHKMFYGSLKESSSEKEIQITDVRPEIFDQLLKYMYTGILEIDGIEEAIQLHQTAHKYIIMDVVNICIQYLAKNLTQKNLFDIYSCLEMYMDEMESLPLHLQCANLIDQWAEDVFHSNAFLIMKADVVHDITARSTLQLSSEMVLFEALVQWSMAECKRRHLPITNENKRKVLGNTLFNVRFGLLTWREVLKGPVMSGIVKEDDRKRFSSSPRLKAAFSTSRLGGKVSYAVFNIPNQEHSVSFIFDRNVILTSVLLAADLTTVKNDESFLRVIQNGEVLVETTINEQTTEERSDFSRLVELAHPVYIEPQKKYVLYAWLKACPRIVNAEVVNPVSTWFDGTKECKAIWEEETLPSGRVNETTLNTGQWFHLYFTLPLREESVVSRLQKLAMKAKFI